MILVDTCVLTRLADLNSADRPAARHAVLTIRKAGENLIIVPTQIDTLIYHTGDKSGLADYQSAEKILADLLAHSLTTDQLITKLEARHFPWGQSDGN